MGPRGQRESSDKLYTLPKGYRQQVEAVRLPDNPRIDARTASRHLREIQVEFSSRLKLALDACNWAQVERIKQEMRRLGEA